MFQENELITFFIVLGVVVFLLLNRKRVQSAEQDHWLIWSFVFYAVSAVLTLAETLIWPVLLNCIEHLFILLHTVFFTLWMWLIVKRNREGKA